MVGITAHETSRLIFGPRRAMSRHMDRLPYDSNLDWHNGKLRVRVLVPKPLQATLGRTKYTKNLGTANLNEARRLSHPWIARFNREIAQAEGETLRGTENEADRGWRRDAREKLLGLADEFFVRATLTELERRIEAARQAFVSDEFDQTVDGESVRELVARSNAVKPADAAVIADSEDAIALWIKHHGANHTIKPKAIKRKRAVIRELFEFLHIEPMGETIIDPKTALIVAARAAFLDAGGGSGGGGSGIGFLGSAAVTGAAASFTACAVAASVCRAFDSWLDFWRAISAA